MIWHQEDITVPEAPVGSKVRLYGIYNPPEDQANSHAIELKVEISPGEDDTATILTIYSHNPQGLGHQEAPLAEDIRGRYNPKILKARGRLQATKFADLTQIKRIP